jgi:hypothetical protein
MYKNIIFHTFMPKMKTWFSIKAHLKVILTLILLILLKGNVDSIISNAFAVLLKNPEL